MTITKEFAAEKRWQNITLNFCLENHRKEKKRKKNQFLGFLMMS